MAKSARNAPTAIKGKSGAFAIDPDEDGVTQQDAGKRSRIFGRTNHGHREIVCDKCLLPFTYSKHSRAWH